jgi:hypothetical protein
MLKNDKNLERKKFIETQSEIHRRQIYMISYMIDAIVLIFDWICWGEGRILWWR